MNDELWVEYRESIIDKLHEEAEGNESMSAREYVTTYSEYSDKDLSDEIISGLNQMATMERGGLRGFCRKYPLRDQDIMAIALNPKLNVENVANPNSDIRKLASITDMRDRENECVRTSFFKGGHKAKIFRRQIAKVHQEGLIDGLPTKVEEDNITKDRVYLTNIYKFATQKGRLVPNWAKDGGYPEGMLEKEIEEVRPEALIPMGGDAWDALKNDVTPAQETIEHVESDPDELGITSAAGYKFYHQKYELMVLPLVHPSARGDPVYKPIYRLSQNNQ